MSNTYWDYECDDVDHLQARRTETGMKAELMNPEAVIENEVKNGMTQRQVAQTYWFALYRSTHDVDWERINKAILSRWKPSGLDRIKWLAWSGKCWPETCVGTEK